ncbi:sensor histidine kinase [Jannaschia sp. R86511]|uniref:sensor histidine kinase n=1 Tax=Jannaschia sp. R86511 TaxID=3093853 RepID=UPI0036D39F8A
MRRRLLVTMLLVAVLAVTGFGVPLAVATQAFYRDEALLVLFAEASRAAVAVPGTFQRDGDLPELPRAGDGVELGLYTRDGRLLTGAGPATADAPVLAVLTGAADQQDRNQLVVVVPVSQEETVVGAVRAGLPQSHVSARTHRAWAAMAALAGVVLALCGVLATRRSRRLTAPLSSLRDDASIIGSGGQVAPRPTSGMPEIDVVHGALVDASARLNRSIARERGFSADVAHQLRTPLASLRIRLETEQLGPGARHEPLIEECLQDVTRLQETITDLVELARDEQPRRGRLHLAEVLADLDRRWQPRADVVHRTLRTAVAPLPDVAGSQAAVRQILDVLVDNALKHGEGDVVVSVEAVGRGAVVTVQDHGTLTIDPEVAFTRRHPSATGAGIGLALARRLAEAEGMHLSVSGTGPSPSFRLSIGGDPPS